MSITSHQEFQTLDIQSGVELRKIQQLVEKAQWSQAYQAWTNLASQAKQSVEALLIGSEILEQKNDCPAALKCLHQACDLVTESNPVLFTIYKAMGNLYLKAGDIEAAEEKYNLAYGLNHSDENLLINYGVLEIQKGDFSSARVKFADVVQSNAGSDSAWVGLALVHRACADQELARACLLRALDENAYNKIAVTQLYAWGNEDGVDMNHDHLERYLEKNPTDGDVQKISNFSRQ